MRAEPVPPRRDARPEYLGIENRGSDIQGERLAGAERVQRPGETLALNIWASRTEALGADATQIANLSSAVLMVMVLAFSLLAHVLEHRIRRNMGEKA